VFELIYSHISSDPEILWNENGRLTGIISNHQVLITQASPQEKADGEIDYREHKRLTLWNQTMKAFSRQEEEKSQLQDQVSN
jgi:hypothetical protein